MPNPYGYSPPFVAGFGLKRRPCRHPSVYPPPKSPLSHKWLFLLATRQRVQALSALVPQRRFIEGDLLDQFFASWSFMPNSYGYSPPFVAGFGLKRRPCRHQNLHSSQTLL